MSDHPGNKNTLDQILDTWVGLNDVMRSCGMRMAQDLMTCEMNGRRRKVFVLRIHSRINRLRALDERAELLKQLGNLA